MIWWERLDKYRDDYLIEWLEFKYFGILEEQV